MPVMADRNVQHPVDFLTMIGSRFTQNFSFEQFIAPVNADQAQYQENDHQETVDRLLFFSDFSFSPFRMPTYSLALAI